jgi:hypothetical protein
MAEKLRAARTPDVNSIGLVFGQAGGFPCGRSVAPQRVAERLEG